MACVMNPGWEKIWTAVNMVMMDLSQNEERLSMLSPFLPIACSLLQLNWMAGCLTKH